MKMTLGFSPCPNDTFIFDALVNKKIDTEGIELELFLEDVQTLNQWSIENRLDISKISYGVYPLLLGHYDLLDSGGALGQGVGPLLIAGKPMLQPDIRGLKVAIPGQNTTAHVLFSLAFPDSQNKAFMIFSAIEDAILRGHVDCGVIIHENRFTYQQKGLFKWMDLGAYWEMQTGLPIPLGGIVMKKTIDSEMQQKVNRLIRNSIEYAFAKYPQLGNFVKNNSQEMEESVMRQHIDLYVNDYSLSLGEQGKKAIDFFVKVYNSMGKPNAQPFSLAGL